MILRTLIFSLLLVSCASRPYVVQAVVTGADGKETKIQGTVQPPPSRGGVLGATINLLTEIVRLIPGTP